MDLSASGPPDAGRQLAALLCDPAGLPSLAEESAGSVIETAASHGVAGLLLTRAALAGISPGPAWAELRERAAAQMAASALRDAESMRVLDRARYSELPLVVLKGLALAYTVYAQPWTRERGDTDLLVHRDDIARFDRLFQDLGYAVLPHVRGELTLPQRHYVRDDERGFRHAWDLHWRLTTSQALRFALPEDRVWANAATAPALVGAKMPARSDALLLACIHRLAHHFDDKRLIWLWDIRLLLEAMTEEDLAAVEKGVTRDARAAAAARQSLSVARDWVAVRIPDRLGVILEMSTDTAPAFLWSGSRRRITYLIGEVRAARRQDRLRLLVERVLPSRSSMRERYPSVPELLLPFAYLWRLAIGIPGWIRKG